MKPFKITNRGMALGPGVQVRLTAAQSAPRLGKLKQLTPVEPDGRAAFAVLELVSFKAGETIEYGGELLPAAAPLPSPAKDKKDVGKTGKAGLDK